MACATTKLFDSARTLLIERLNDTSEAKASQAPEDTADEAARNAQASRSGTTDSENAAARAQQPRWLHDIVTDFESLDAAEQTLPDFQITLTESTNDSTKNKATI
jgi:hypothetical protein